MKFNWTLALAALLAFLMAPLNASALYAQGDEAAAETEEVEEATEEAADDKEEEKELTEVEKIVEEMEEIRSKRPRTLAELREMQAGMLKLAEKLLEVETDKTSENYQFAQRVVYSSKAQALGQMEKEERAEALKELKEFIVADGLTPTGFSLARAAATSVERSDAGAEAAAEVYQEFAELFEKSEDKQVQGMATMLAGSARRLTLPGNALELTGTTFEGEEFDIASLKGKVVLVDFWATWCGPCIREFPNMLKNYEGYHEKGFEIVGISLDQDREALAEYLEAKEVPWITLHGKEVGEDGEASYGRNEATEYYGVVGIPTMFLLDKEGKVISTSARGEELTRLLKETLGEPVEKEEPADTEKEAEEKEAE
jgi:thiol-disulfide isomerase/thioredoxin